MRGLEVGTLPLRGVLVTNGSLHRLPRWATAQATDPYLSLMDAMPSGGRLVFRTDSRVLELDVLLTGLKLADQPAQMPTFDLVLDGRRVSTETATDQVTLHAKGIGDIEVLPGAPTTVHFALPGLINQRVEVWLPHRSKVQLLAARIDAGASLLELEETRPRWVHYGSSISQCLEARRPTETWPGVAARLSRLELINLGLGGQCMVDQFVARTIRDLPADLISLELGVNVVAEATMRERTFRAAVHGFLDTIRDGHPTTSVLLITPFLCPAAEDVAGPLTIDQELRFIGTGTSDLTMRRVREVLAEVFDQRADRHLRLMDGLSLLGLADAHHLYDNLHPDADGYLLIGRRFHEQLGKVRPASAGPQASHRSR